MSQPDSLPITEEDFNKTPPVVQALVLTLWEKVSVLEAEISALREQVAQNSTNSSRPPSSDRHRLRNRNGPLRDESPVVNPVMRAFLEHFSLYFVQNLKR
jgi:hypothetical protein